MTQVWSMRISCNAIWSCKKSTLSSSRQSLPTQSAPQSPSTPSSMSRPKNNSSPNSPKPPTRSTTARPSPKSDSTCTKWLCGSRSPSTTRKTTSTLIPIPCSKFTSTSPDIKSRKLSTRLRPSRPTILFPIARSSSLPLLRPCFIRVSKTLKNELSMASRRVIRPFNSSKITPKTWGKDSTPRTSKTSKIKFLSTRKISSTWQICLHSSEKTTSSFPCPKFNKFLSATQTWMNRSISNPMKFSLNLSRSKELKTNNLSRFILTANAGTNQKSRADPALSSSKASNQLKTSPKLFVAIIRASQFPCTPKAGSARQNRV